jgi:hypothetical protein
MTDDTKAELAHDWIIRHYPHSILADLAQADLRSLLRIFRHVARNPV